MKKLYLLTLISVLTLTTFAQDYKLGDLIEKDGIVAIVVYVDESGQHGLMLSPRAYVGDECFTEKEGKQDFEAAKVAAREKLESQQKFVAPIIKGKIKKQCKKTGEDPKEVYATLMNALRDTLEKQLELIDMIERMPRSTCPVEHKDKELNEMYQNILSSNSEYGKENTQAILDFCIKNDISMQDWFPEYYWVTQLGKDWFIPGAHELELFGLQFVDRLGAGVKNSTLKMDKIKERQAVYDTYQRNWKYVTGVYPYRDPVYQAYYGVVLSHSMLIKSSTLSKTMWCEDEENKHKIVFNNSTGGVIGAIAGAADKATNVQFLTFFYGPTNSNGLQSFFATGVEGTYYAMAEF